MYRVRALVSSTTTVEQITWLLLSITTEVARWYNIGNLLNVDDRCGFDDIAIDGIRGIGVEVCRYMSILTDA